MNKYVLAPGETKFVFSYPRLLVPEYDSLFKSIVTEGWCVSSTGDVESPTGYFSITEIPAHDGERDEMWAAVLDETTGLDIDADLPDPGWYLTIEESNGMICVFEMKHKEQAQVAYQKYEKDYDDWLGQMTENPSPLNQLRL